jgi:predicted esterase
MKNLFTFYCVIIVSFLMILFFCTESAMSQQTGNFDKQITEGTYTGQVSFYVPATAAPSGGFPLIIGLHPAGTPGSSMRDMILSSAQSIGAILACPEGPDKDASAIIPILEWVKKNYSTDDQKVILTGYSAGGYPALKTGLGIVDKFKGIIAIAPTVSTFDVSTSTAAEIAIAFIVGKDDQLYDNIMTVINAVNQNGGTTKLIDKPGVGHTGEYYWSPEFTTDWIECYNFCLNTVLKLVQAHLLKPTDGSLDQQLQVDLSWVKLKNITSYNIEISTSGSIFKSDNVSTESYTISGLKKNTKYSWKVNGVNLSGSGPWSDTWNFTTYNDAPSDVVVLLEPAKNADIKGPDMVFKCKTVPNATKYHFQIIEDVSDILFAQDSNVTTTSNFAQYNATKLKAGMVYRWHVRAFNKYGTSPWSEEWKFSVIPNPPNSKTILQEPANNATNQSLNIKFKWTVVINSDNYHLQVKNSKDNNYFYNDSSIAKPSSGNYVEVWVNGLSPDTKYTWQVRGLNRGGSGPWSNEFTLTTQPGTSVFEVIPSIFKANVYPNPNEGNSVLSFNLPKDEISNIEVYNSMGVRLSIPFDNIYSAGDYKLQLNLEDYPDGAYYIKIISANKVEIKGFMIIK